MRLLSASAFAFCIERIVNDKFAFKDFVIAKPERAEASRIWVDEFFDEPWAGNSIRL